MATPTLTDPELDRHNPGDTHEADLVGRSVDPNYVSKGLNDLEQFANDPAQHEAGESGASAVNERESAGAGGWAFDGDKVRAARARAKIRSAGGKTRLGRLLNTKKKKAGAGALLGGGIIAILLSLAGISSIALVHIDELIEEKIDTMASSVDIRMQKIITSRVTHMATKGKCTGISILCKYDSFTDQQLETMKENGLRVVTGPDNDMKDVTPDMKPDKTTRIVFTDDPSKKPVYASDLAKAMVTDTDLSAAMKEAFPSRWSVWNDKIANGFRAAKKLIGFPKITDTDSGGDPKTNQEQFDKNLQQQELGGQEPGTVLEGTTGDDSTIDGPVSDAEKAITADQNSGTPNMANGAIQDNLNTTANGISGGKGVFGKTLDAAKSLLNPLNLLVIGCQSREAAEAVVYTAKIPALLQEIRMYTVIASVAGMIRVGNATPNDVSMPMNMLNKNNQYGSNWDNSTGYAYVSGQTSDQPIEAGISGSPLLSAITTGLMMSNKIGATVPILGKNTTANACAIISSTAGQIATMAIGLAAIVFSGGGAAGAEGAAEGSADAAEAAVSESVEEVATTIGQKIVQTVSGKVAGIVADPGAAVKAAGQELLSQARGFAGFFIMGLLINNYAIPFLAHAAMGTLFSGDMDGVAAMDTMVAGAGAANSEIAQSRGMEALTPAGAKSYLAFNAADTSEYVASQQQQANPLDVNNPYSVSNSVLASIGMFMDNFNIFQSPSNLLSAPGKILSSIFPSTLNPAANAANAASAPDTCQDPDIQASGYATDPFCNVLYGFNDPSVLNTDPDTEVNYMLSNGYIDDDGNPQGAYASYVNSCFVQPENSAEPMVVGSSVLPSTDVVPAECNKPTGISQETFNMFHLYYFDQGVANQLDSPYVPTAPASTSSTPTTTSGGSCAAGTVDEGTAQGNTAVIHLCGIPGTKESDMSDHLAHVNADVSGKVLAMINAMKAATGDSVIDTNASFRSLATQKYLYMCYTTKSCNSGNKAAVPGTSNHGMGHAIDFDMSESGVYNWLWGNNQENPKKYGFSDNIAVTTEIWHFSITGT